MKTPEQMAEDWMNEEYGNTSHWVHMGKEMSIDAYLAGYKAAKDQAADKRNYLEKAFQAGHLFMATGVDFDEWYARVFLAKQQLADVSKVMTKPPKEEK